MVMVAGTFRRLLVILDLDFSIFSNLTSLFAKAPSSVE